MAAKNVIVVRFTEPSKAYQALTVLKECDADGRIGLESAAVVERTPTGELRISEGADNVGLVGIALTRAPKAELSHYAYTWREFGELGRVADRLKQQYGRGCIWGPSRHGPGNNQFLYFHDADGAMVECCSDMAKMDDGYQPRNWSMRPSTINQWGAPPPLRFLLTGFPIA